MNSNMIAPEIVLENERVLLRPLEIGDANHLRSISENEPENWEFGLESAAGEENLNRYLAAAIQGAKELHSCPFIIFDKRFGQYAGSTRYYQIQPKHRRLAIGYTWIGNAFKQTGLNAHCKLLLLTHAFESMNMERIEFMADTLNTRSIASILALGARREGTLRSHAVRPDGTRRDTAVFSILKQEWLELVKPSLLQKISGERF